MPGIDIESVRAQVSMAKVLELVDFSANEQVGNQVRGACPIHASSTAASRSFSANLSENVFKCFKCGASGGTLELWAAVRGLTVYEAAVELCEKLGIDVPWVKRW